MANVQSTAASASFDDDTSSLGSWSPSLGSLSPGSPSECPSSKNTSAGVEELPAFSSKAFEYDTSSLGSWAPSPPFGGSSSLKNTSTGAEKLSAYSTAFISSMSSGTVFSSTTPNNYTIVRDVDGMVRLMDTVAKVVCQLDGTSTALYLDAEGNNLSRNGELSILELHLDTTQCSHTYLIHVHVLRQNAFSTTDRRGKHTLKSILQDDSIAKVFFDVRMDSDALYGQYGVLLGGVIDLQLMEIASRRKPWNGKPLKGLKVCLRDDAPMSAGERGRVLSIKENGKRLWRPEDGGSFERFNDDPLTQGIINYCVADCAYMPMLYKHYNQLMNNEIHLMAEGAGYMSKGTGYFKGRESTEIKQKFWALKTIEESRVRVHMALSSPSFADPRCSPWWKWYG